MNLNLAIQIVKTVTKDKVTEPVRLADKISREIIANYDYENYDNLNDDELDVDYYFSQI
jgi:hypothetical protein